ncbi:uncharacterized protein FOMMEDRAFT_149150 [Fomitiporia mediterranea MF3/22]|uniref:uncharacterized protein n=1 Tax=Fomitiporia mediterranea (strain MF3/22) TaxID=694068 RepID=UPI000440863A|nr:uncharacterized protein FOMMEDRAFT_149150 [Fomitiporia mediterranea MF3/22]EJC98340.1 hypothetical protein FOMMEDRAFT_149150 [Fomitiporia mediterranea MF3/22]
MAEFFSDKSSFQSSGRGRGRGGRPSDRGRGRGGWRGGNQRGRDGPAPARNESRQNFSKPPLTHFLSVPLGHLPAVQSAMNSFSSQLLAAQPPIDGLDHSIIVTPRRLHLTLGVMSLEDDSAALSTAGGAAQVKKTVSAASEYLKKIRPSINNALNGHALRVPLTAIDIMKPERNDASRAHIMFAGPSASDLRSVDGQRLKYVCELINSEFIKAGFAVDDKRPLKLHCTLINTSHRKPRPQGGYARRVPFSFSQVCNSDAVSRLRIAEPESTSSSSAGAGETIALTQQTRTAESDLRGERATTTPVTAMEKVAGQNTGSYAVPVDFGTHTVSEIQICRMGSWGPEGEYVCVGKISLDGE